jgi:hypothetical protein
MFVCIFSSLQEGITVQTVQTRKPTQMKTPVIHKSHINKDAMGANTPNITGALGHHPK